MHGGDGGLAVLALPPAVRPRLGQQQRPVAGEVLQAGEVAPQVRLGVQVDVERADVEERQRQVLGRRVVHVGQERLRGRRLHVVVELANEALDPGLPVPPDDGGGNLVAEGEDEGGGVAGQLADPRDDVFADAAAEVGVVEERDVLRPGQADHHAQPVTRGRVEEVRVGRGVGADGVQAGFAHLGEVVRDDGGGWELASRRVRREGAVGDALDGEAPVPDGQELAVDDGARLGGGGGHGGRFGWASGPAARAVGASAGCGVNSPRQGSPLHSSGDAHARRTTGHGDTAARVSVAFERRRIPHRRADRRSPAPRLRPPRAASAGRVAAPAQRGDLGLPSVRARGRQPVASLIPCQAGFAAGGQETVYSSSRIVGYSIPSCSR